MPKYQFRIQGLQSQLCNQKSTSPQQANYEDSLAAECLIRTQMEKGDMEDPILRYLFIRNQDLNTVRWRLVFSSRECLRVGQRRRTWDERPFKDEDIGMSY
ncbi:unnamed protein product [Paramecium octaurelia]|uniref:Uncharacterized protein n=1 Tax=Paramecium octaurelia TaxID=43137 RepID=A0A8S1UIR7_PAROT|nr:unnamed protein product [Paramecium octaurelia]